MGYEKMKQRFASADPRFGPVPFWWWSGEEVTEERVRWQLEKFRAGGLRNIGIIQLAPTGPQYGSVGDRPVFFSEDWWRLFEVALREAERLGMYLWFYDQIGFSGANLLARIVAERPQLAGYQLRRFRDSGDIPEGSVRLAEHDGFCYAAVRQGFNWLDPNATLLLIDRVHGEFERRFPHDLGRTIAGSFQDELPPLPLWTPEISEAYRDKFGESLDDSLPALFEDLPGAAEVRRRVYRLAAELAERAFFIPLGEWHEKRGMLIGCDQAGPARRVEVHGAQRLYLDYFRTHRWYNSAGCDMDGEIKPHSSMVHLHGGKRVWLEAFHSSGWGGTLEETMHWLVPWFQAGATLYSPHAVYYSTRGGWWEWAPPDTGWRQPYFEHYPVFADTVSRVCGLLSEGTHVADVAVHYASYAVSGFLSLEDGGKNEHPMAVSNRVPNEKVAHIDRVYKKLTSRWNRKEPEETGALRDVRRDYDVVDDSALMKAMPEGEELAIAGERFSVVVLCGTEAMDEAAKQKLEEWIAQGGWVIAVDVPAEERTLAGAAYAETPEEAAALIDERLPKRIEGAGMALQRQTDDADVFLLLPPHGLLAMHEPAEPETKLPESASYRLRTAGEPELWNPVTGERRPLPHKREGEWAELEVPFADWPAALIVCPRGREADAGKGDAAGRNGDDTAPDASFGVPDTSRSVGLKPAVPAAPLQAAGSVEWAGPWNVTAVPTLDNRYGDFDLHDERPELLGIERRSFKVCAERVPAEGEQAGWHRPELDDSAWAERLWSESAYWLASKGESFDPEAAWPVVYSQTFGDLSFRTWAGRMGRVPRRFLNLGKAEPGETVCARTHVIAPQTGRYWIRAETNAALTGRVNGRAIEWTGGPEEMTARIDLKEGGNELELLAKARSSGLIRVGVEVNRQAGEPLPKYIYVRSPNLQSALVKRLESPSGRAVRQVRIEFAARGRAALCVNGTMLTEHGDFNPYIRQGQEEVDASAWWKEGLNEVKVTLPEGQGEVLIDGVVEFEDGGRTVFCTGTDWRDERGGEPLVYHEAVLQFAETETLWIAPRPHPLKDVGWLMPESAPEIDPLPFLADPSAIGKPVWLRFPLPAGAAEMTLRCTGRARAWLNGAEIPLRGGKAEFPPQPAGTTMAIRVEPAGAESEAAVLTGPIRFRTAKVQGELGDWRTALNLPHHSGAVEYETTFETDGRGRIALDLGHVRGTAEVWIDGKPLGVRLWRPYRYASRELEAGSHRMRVRVTNTLGAHYEVGRPSAVVGANNAVMYWTHRDQSAWRPVFPAGGLFGPVRLAAE
ncbi:hypothetical protein [Cohnella zeiphila]|uniref:hypothetical protein n=1 Tax=Cohnella zeiphila TaxID=2761120 RepID=UPI003080C935